MSEYPFGRHELLKRLGRAAQVRAVVTMLFVIPMMVAAGIVAEAFPDNNGKGIVGGLIFVAGLIFVSWLMTEFYCKRRVTCPICGGSLWKCGTGNFKPRHMRLRGDISECPTCHARIE